MQSNVGQRIRCYLSIANKNVTELAKEIDVSQSSLNKVVNGDGNPSYRTLLSLTLKIGLNLNWLVLGEGEMMRKNYNKNTTSIHNKLDDTAGPNTEAEHLKVQVALLQAQLKDKETIINLLKGK